RRLTLHGCGLTEEGIRALAGSEVFRGVERLVLSSGVLDDATLECLTSFSTMTGLHSLGLSNNHFGRIGMAALARAPWSALAELDLSRCGLDDEAAIALAKCPLLANLHTLDLSYNSIETDGAAALARSPFLSGVIELDLGHNEIPVAGARAF